MHCAGNSGRGDLAIFAAVEQHELLALINHLFHGADVDVEGQRGHNDPMEGIMRDEKSKNQRTEKENDHALLVLWFFGSWNLSFHLRDCLALRLANLRPMPTVDPQL